MFEAVEKLKREWTDRYVVIDGKRPELARFQGLTGQVKTVNMSGRALVQFDAWNNIGWYDIAVDYLKIVPKPEPKPVEAKPAKKPASEKPQTSADNPAVAPDPVGEKPAAAAPAAAEKPAEAAPAKPAAPAGEKKMSTADILAALKKKKS